MPHIIQTLLLGITMIYWLALIVVALWYALVNPIGSMHEIFGSSFFVAAGFIALYLLVLGGYRYLHDTRKNRLPISSSQKRD